MSGLFDEDNDLPFEGGSHPYLRTARLVFEVAIDPDTGGKLSRKQQELIEEITTPLLASGCSERSAKRTQMIEWSARTQGSKDWRSFSKNRFGDAWDMVVEWIQERTQHILDQQGEALSSFEQELLEYISEVVASILLTKDDISNLPPVHSGT